MDSNDHVSSGLSSAYIQGVLKTWPDQELKGFLLDGVDFRADLPLQIVLRSHLVSLANAWPSAHKEFKRFHGFGYHAFTNAFHSCQFETYLKDLPLESTK